MHKGKLKIFTKKPSWILVGSLMSTPLLGIDFGLGRAPTSGEIAKDWHKPIGPQGQNLPVGKGQAQQGEALYQSFCAACHGKNLEGGVAFKAPRLIGGRGSLSSDKPVKTVESYWPYATTLFDYIKRAMPMMSPGILSDDQVYALSAYILAKSDIIPYEQVLDHKNLPQVQMPNRDGFVSNWEK